MHAHTAIGMMMIAQGMMNASFAMSNKKLIFKTTYTDEIIALLNRTIDAIDDAVDA